MVLHIEDDMATTYNHNVLPIDHRNAPRRLDQAIDCHKLYFNKARRSSLLLPLLTETHHQWRMQHNIWGGGLSSFLLLDLSSRHADFDLVVCQHVYATLVRIVLKMHLQCHGTEVVQCRQNRIQNQYKGLFRWFG